MDAVGAHTGADAVDTNTEVDGVDAITGVHGVDKWVLKQDFPASSPQLDWTQENVCASRKF